MSLEQALAESTEAMKALTIALAAHTIALTAHTGKATTTGPAPAVAVAPKVVDPKPAAATGGALDYEKDVKPLALRVAKEKGREKLLEILGTFKATNANMLKPEQFGDFTKACNTALAAK